MKKLKLIIKVIIYIYVYLECDEISCAQRCINGFPARCDCFPGYQINPTNSSDCLGRLFLQA